ncbi:MAG: hypothetical protein M3P48_01540 [Actinomycetota bacterium]|nr:hypothetical protein [Actinomycetota bacterium]
MVFLHIIDITLVRWLLIPAAMHLMGDANWWAPRPWRGCTTGSASASTPHPTQLCFRR